MAYFSKTSCIRVKRTARSCMATESAPVNTLQPTRLVANSYEFVCVGWVGGAFFAPPPKKKY